MQFSVRRNQERLYYHQVEADVRVEMTTRFRNEQCILLFAILWTVARRTPLSMEFSRQEYWSR